MRKEVGIALFLGSIIGVVLALVITTSARAPKSSATNTQPDQNQQTATTSKLLPFALVKPEINQAVAATTTVNGNVPTEAEYLIIKNGTSQTVNKLTGTSFNADLSFTPGPSPVEFIAVKKDNSIERIKRTFMVTNNSYEDSSRKLFQGTITDIAEQTIQIRTANGDVAQVVVTDSTIYKSYIKTAKDLKFSDIAIGDYVATIGALSEKGILSTQELFVLPPQLAETETAVDAGVISEVSKKQIVVQTKDANKTYEISSHSIRVINADGTISRGTSAALKKDTKVIITDTTYFVIPQA